MNLFLCKIEASKFLISFVGQTGLIDLKWTINIVIFIGKFPSFCFLKGLWTIFFIQPKLSQPTGPVRHFDSGPNENSHCDIARPSNQSMSGYQCTISAIKFQFLAKQIFKGQVKNNEANVLQNGPKIKIIPLIHFYSGKMTTSLAKPSQQNKSPACDIFELPHYL